MKPFQTVSRVAMLLAVGYAFLILSGWSKVHLLGSPTLYLYWPVLISIVLLVAFGRTLWTAPSMAERFARRQKPDLTPAEVIYCRHVTQVWCVFFLLNGCIALYLALQGPLKAWALYTGVISYGLIGTLFALEYGYRQWRFPR